MRTPTSLVPDLVLSRHQRGVRRGGFEAATLFADISGFTPLTERLMTHGREGAEVLTQVLNEVFTPLVGEVHARGGFLSTFAGDAFTAVFPARRKHAAWQALSAAASIRDHVRAAGRVETSFGSFELAVRVGVAAGNVSWGIVGKGAHRAYFVRGPSVDGAARAEHLAGHGEVVADESALERLHDAVRIEVAPSGPKHHRLHDLDRAPRPRFARRAPVSVAALGAFLPEAVLSLEEEGEFRDVGVAFLSFEEPRQHAVLDAFASRVLERCEVYGGYFNKLDFGDKGGVMLLLFGAPVAHEDDAARAARMLLDLAGTAGAVRWRAGVTFGTVYAGFVGGVERAEYTAIGDVVNTAARLMAASEWGEILVSTRAQARAGHAFVVEPREPLRLKGMAEPVACCRLVARERAWASPAFEGALVGRRQEIAAIEAFLAALDEGRFAGVVHVTGEPGVGKSRLAFELRQRRAPGTRWLHGAADEVLVRPFGPFKRLLHARFLPRGGDPGVAAQAAFEARHATWRKEVGRAVGESERDPGLLAELDRTLPVLAALLDLPAPGPLWAELDPQGRHENSLLALRAFVLGESRIAPVIVEIEDGHALDEASRELVSELTRGTSSFPMALLLTSRLRDDGTPPDLGLEAGVPRLAIELDRLAEEDLALLATQELGRPAAPGLLGLLIAQSRGNPFFALQLLRYLHEQGGLGREGDAWELLDEAVEIPATIQAVLVARIDRLSPALKAAAKAAAVIGRRFETELLTRVVDRDVSPLLEQGNEERLWAAASEIEYVFRHVMLRDVAYGMQLKARLRELHARVAKALQALHGPDAAPRFAELAWHYEQARIVDLAVRYLLRAADHARGAYQNQDALELSDRLLGLTADDGAWATDRARARLLKAEVLTLVGRAEEAVALAEQVERTGGEATRGRACLVLGSALEELGRYDEAIARYHESRADAKRRGDQRGMANALGNEGECHRYQGRFDEALRCYEQAQALDEAAGNRAGVQRHVNNLGILHAMRGEDAQALETFQAGLAAARESADREGEARALANVGILLRRMDQLGPAVEHYSRALELATELGNRRLQGMVTGNLGNLLMAQGAWARAAAYHERAHAISREIGDAVGMVRTQGNLAATLRHLGETMRADDLFREALEGAARLGARDLEVYFAHEFARFAFDRGDPEAAERWNRRAQAVATEIGYAAVEPALRVLAARLALTRGEPGAEDVARALLAEASDEEAAAELAHALWRRTRARDDRDAALGRLRGVLTKTRNPTLQAAFDELRAGG